MVQGLAQGCAVHRQGRKKLSSAELLLEINCPESVRSYHVFAFVQHFGLRLSLSVLSPFLSSQSAILFLQHIRTKTR